LYVLIYKFSDAPDKEFHIIIIGFVNNFN